MDAKEWEKEAQRLKNLRDHLNKYVRHLHVKRKNQLSAYTAIGISAYGKDIPKLNFSWPSSDFHNDDDLFELKRLAEDLEINANEVGVIPKRHFSLINQTEWSPNWQNSLVKAAKELVVASEDMDKAAKAFFDVTELGDIPLDDRGRNVMNDLALVLPEAAGHDWGFVLRPDIRSVCEELIKGLHLITTYYDTINQLSRPWRGDEQLKVKHGLEQIEQHLEITKQLSVSYNSSIFELDMIQLKADLEKAEKTIWPLRSIRKRRVHSILAKATEEKKKIDLPGDIEKLAAIQRIETEINCIHGLPGSLGDIWAGIDTNPGDLLTAILFQPVLSEAVNNGIFNSNGNFEPIASGRCGACMASDLERMWALSHLRKDLDRLDHLKDKTNGLWQGLNSSTDVIEKSLVFYESLSKIISQIAHSPASIANIKEKIAVLLGHGNSLIEPSGAVNIAASNYRKAHQKFISSLNTFKELILHDSADTASFVNETAMEISSICKSILEMDYKLRPWCAWRRIRSKTILKGLGPLVKAVEEDEIEPGKIQEAFKTNYSRWWINALVDEDEVLRNFVSAEHEQRISEFKSLDDSFIKLTRNYIRAGLCANIPDQNESGKSSEWGLLRREMQKKKLHMPLRKLLSQIPGAINKLVPCMLMSPLSIAQYLSADTALFDVVVFDEASQITVWDAIGAIARGKQVIMVGDPKQLPPTHFFDKLDSDVDSEDVDIELESILDECIGANIPTMNLSWHYRSRHESLIAFSNHKYYGGGLVTFPSPVTKDKAVSFHYIGDGVYEKGGARINKPEAIALVLHIVERINAPSFKDSGKTIGIVTFNSEQQRLIEDLLDAERRKTPLIEPYFSDNDIEPIFVKNIENVQGDERDIMYFSITYGPDLTGAISMNFGPMNKDGGERRLNVAVTRARHELLVFSSLKPEQIDLSRTQATGVKDMKHFLEFAERGTKAIAEAINGSVGDFESPFEQAVASAIAEKGWTVHPQIGVSSFRIDLGIVDPDSPGAYLAGIECDGATYHRSATARDRDKLREYILKDLGWDILRIWSTDWWIDPIGTLNKIHEKLEHLLENRRAIRGEVHVQLKNINKIESFEKNAIYDDFIAEKKTYDGNQINESHLKIRLSPYNTYNGSLSFADPRSCGIDDIAEGLKKIIEAEGPMLSKKAFDIYLRGCGIRRMGKDLKNIMTRVLKNMIDEGQIDVEFEYGISDLDQAIVRLSGRPKIILRERGERSFEEIPPSEILTVAKYLLTTQSFHKGSDDHLRAVLDVFALKRLTGSTESKLLEIMDKNFDYVA